MSAERVGSVRLENRACGRAGGRRHGSCARRDPRERIPTPAPTNTRRASTAGSVFTRIEMSSQIDQFSLQRGQSGDSPQRVPDASRRQARVVARLEGPRRQPAAAAMQRGQSGDSPRGVPDASRRRSRAVARTDSPRVSPAPTVMQRDRAGTVPGLSPSGADSRQGRRTFRAMRSGSPSTRRAAPAPPAASSRGSRCRARSTSSRGSRSRGGRGRRS